MRTAEQHRSPDACEALERLITDLSATFIGLPANEVDGRIEQAIGLIAEFAGAERAAVAERSEGQAAFRGTHQWTREGFPRVAWQDPSDAYPWGSQRVFVERQPLVLNSLDELPSDAAFDRESFEAQGIRSVAVFPLVVGDVVIGALSFASLAGERRWARDLVDRLQLAANMLGNTLARRRAEFTLSQSLAFERLIAELSAMFVGLPVSEVDERVTGVLERVGRFLDLDHGNVAEALPGTADLHVTHQWARDAAWRIPPVVPAEVIPWACEQLLGGHEVPFAQVEDLPEQAVRERAFVSRHGPKSSALLPRSWRGGRPLIAVNCAALPSTLIESELFGHEKGPFTGATHARAGRFELADGSTLFLDEIGDLQPALQAKLLRALSGTAADRSTHGAELSGRPLLPMKFSWGSFTSTGLPSRSSTTTLASSSASRCTSVVARSSPSATPTATFRCSSGRPAAAVRASWPGSPHGRRARAYDRTSSIGRLAKSLDEARAKGWTVVSMQDDWKTIFPAHTK